MGKRETQLELAMNKHSYYSVIMSMLSNLVIAMNLPDELNRNFPLFLQDALLTGISSIGKLDNDDGKLHYLPHTSITGGFEEDDFGFGTEATAFTVMGKQSKGNINEKLCVLYPYSSRSRNFQIQRCIEHLKEIDLSEMFLIKWSRIAPIILAKDNKTKQALLDVVKSISEGNLTPMLSDNALTLMTENGEPIVTIDLMQADRVRDLQYLNEQRSHIIKELAELFGMPYQVQTKMAQQSIDEINSGNGLCYVLPLDILKNFNAFAEDVNNTFGTDIKFTLNPLIMRELEKYFNQESNDTGSEVMQEVEQATDTDPQEIVLEEEPTEEPTENEPTGEKQEDDEDGNS